MKQRCIADIVREMDDVSVQYNLQIIERQRLEPRFSYLWKEHTKILSEDTQCCSDLDASPEDPTGMNKIRYYAYLTLLKWQIK